MPHNDYWDMSDLEADAAAVAARWRALEALNDAARKLLAHVMALITCDDSGGFNLTFHNLDDIPEVLAMRRALSDIDATTKRD